MMYDDKRIGKTHGLVRRPLASAHGHAPPTALPARRRAAALGLDRRRRMGQRRAHRGPTGRRPREGRLARRRRFDEPMLKGRAAAGAGHPDHVLGTSNIKDSTAQLAASTVFSNAIDTKKRAT